MKINKRIANLVSLATLAFATVCMWTPAHACTIPEIGVNAGSNTVPPVTSIVGIVADGTNLLTVYSRNFTTNLVTPSFFNLGNDGDITASGAWGGPTSTTRATTWAATGNRLSFNRDSGGIITFTNMTVSGSGQFNGGGAAGLSRLLSSADGTSIAFQGFNSNVNQISSTNLIAVGTCTVTASVTGGISGTITLNGTLAAEATQAEFFVDGTLVGVATGAPYFVPFNTSSLKNGSHQLTVKGIFPNGTVTSPVKVFTVYNSMISAGPAHTCAVWQGSAKCWGENADGQLGNNSTSDSLTPANVSGLSTGVTQISAGSSHSCAVVNGAAKCWGENIKGQLGNGTTANSLVPVQVSGLTSGVTQISAGNDFTCALVNGGVKCWGGGNFGALGNGSVANSTVPVQVTGLTSGVQSIAVGAAHGCASLTNLSVKCWGYNVVGQLGNNSTTDSTTPVSVLGPSFLTEIITAGSYHTCSTGGLCWGLNAQGGLGNNSTTNSSVPVFVQGISGVAQMSGGNSHTCAMTTTANLAKCWGWNDFAQLGNGTTTSSLVAVNVGGALAGLRAISAGNTHSCAHLGTGIKCWGNNAAGKLGNGNTNGSNLPISVVGL